MWYTARRDFLLPVPSVYPGLSDAIMYVIKPAKRENVALTIEERRFFVKRLGFLVKFCQYWNLVFYEISMGKVLHDIGCSNKGCATPEVRRDVRAERLHDGKIAVLGHDGREVIGPICDACGSELTIRFVSFAIGRKVDGALAGKSVNDRDTSDACGDCRFGTDSDIDQDVGGLSPEDLRHFFPNGPKNLTPTSFTLSHDRPPTLELTDPTTGNVLQAGLACAAPHSGPNGEPGIALGFRPNAVKIPADAIN